MEEMMKQAKQILSMAAVAVLALTASRIAAEQFVFFDEDLVHDKGTYAQPKSYGGPDNWTSPVNYVDGRVYLRYEAVEKPSDKKLKVQLCFWYGSNKYETCSPSGNFSYSTKGVYYKDLGTPGKWWQKNNNYDWNKKYDKSRLMHKDASSGMLLMTSSCGSHCYKGGDIEDHVPIKIKATVIVVSKGNELAAPAEWSDCKESWCQNSSTTAYNIKSANAHSLPAIIARRIESSGAYIIELSNSTANQNGMYLDMYRTDGKLVSGFYLRPGNESLCLDKSGKVEQGLYILKARGNHTIPAQTVSIF
jgi:hypothetical protein